MSTHRPTVGENRLANNFISVFVMSEATRHLLICVDDNEVSIAIRTGSGAGLCVVSGSILVPLPSVAIADTHS